jgi:hypothetical protein
MQFNINVVIGCIVIVQMLCNAQQTTTKGMLTMASKLDCSQFKTDVEIVRALPFHTSMGSMLVNRTYALTNADNTIHTLYIHRESYVPSNIFCLKNLRVLTIDGTSFNYSTLGYQWGVIPDELGNLKLLNNLQIYNTRINKMTDQLSNLTGLTQLGLINCGLSSLPNLSKLISLTNLTIHSNPLTSLVGLLRVTTLDLYNCQFSDIPAMISPTTLFYLNMENNQLSYVDNLNVYKQLRTINFNGNKIKELLPTINQLIYLTTFLLSKNELQQLPNDILSLTSLRTLNITNNKFAPSELQLIKDNFKKQRPVVNLTA